MSFHGEWTTADFCGQCRGFTFEELIQQNASRKRLFILHGSRCPLCRFFDATLHTRKASAVAMNGVVFWLDRYQSLTSTGLQKSHNIQTAHKILLLQELAEENAQIRFLFSPSANHGKEWPCSRASREELFRWPSKETSVPYRYLSTDSVNIALLKSWITGCRTEHVNSCAEPNPDILSSIAASSGFKLIDCVTRSVVTAPKIFEYVALSYIWGQTLTPYVNDKSLRGPLEDKLPSCLPNTIEDAMKITINLGFRYLWVDKYCINQDPNCIDLQTQLGAMDLIYHAATVTIIAAAGDDSDSGLPGVGSRSRVAHSSIKINGTTWISGCLHTQVPVSLSTWATRGWTYQEDHFARRRLIFTDDQVNFECNTCRRSESMHFAMGKDEDHASEIFGGDHGSPRSTLKLVDHIRFYTKRNLTYQSDALNAMRGIFSSFFRGAPPIRQFWGLPVSATGYWDPDSIGSQQTLSPNAASDLYATLAYGMTWTVSPGSSARRRDDFPSWSWAGWITPVEWLDDPQLGYPLEYRTDTPFEIAVMKQDDTSETLTDDLVNDFFWNKHGEASIYTCLLRIKAEILQVRFVDLCAGDPDLDSGIEPMMRRRFRYAAIPTNEPDRLKRQWPLHPTPYIEKGDEFHRAICEETFDCIILSSWHGLVVRERNGIAERIGLLELRGWHNSGTEWHEIWTRDRDGPHLRSVFPGSRREIVLG